MSDALARANQALKNGRPGEAAGICQDLLRTPNLPEPRATEARTLWEAAAARIGGTNHAIELLEWSLRANPNNPIWLGILADLYRLAARFDDALTTAQSAAALQPGQSAPQIAIARIHADRGDTDAAIAAFLTALAAEPEDPVAHFGLAQMLLLKAEYPAAWVEYEWRHRLPIAKTRRPKLRLPQWNGQCLNPTSGHLVLFNDQGFGDAFQFTRFIPFATARVGRVSLVCDPSCLPLFKTIPGLANVTADWGQVEGATVQTSLASLPGLSATTIETLPNTVPYLTADPERVAHWKTTLLQRLPPGLRVGLAWAGSQGPPGDPRRTVPLAALTQLAHIPGIAFISLQKDKRPGDDARLQQFSNLLDLGAELTDFAETAAIITNLDMVISICSAVTHLTGALGRPIWVMLSRPADWRWLTDREDSVWYPTARLFRQTRTGDWPPVIQAIAAALKIAVATGA